MTPSSLTCGTGHSPIGRHAEKARIKLENKLDRRLAYLDALRSQPVPMPDIPPLQAITVGYQGFEPTNRVFHTLLNIDFNTLEEHLACYGPTGIGKTSYFRFLLRQLIEKDKGVFVEFVDYKNGEGRSIPGATTTSRGPWSFRPPVERRMRTSFCWNRSRGNRPCSLRPWPLPGRRAASN